MEILRCIVFILLWPVGYPNRQTAMSASVEDTDEDLLAEAIHRGGAACATMAVQHAKNDPALVVVPQFHRVDDHFSLVPLVEIGFLLVAWYILFGRFALSLARSITGSVIRLPFEIH
jgi:hypothetical protein